MSKPNLVVSIQGSGTHTLKAALKCKDNVHIHPESFQRTEDMNLHDYELWVPLRDPRLMWKTWVKRRVARDRATLTADNFLRDWENMQAFCETYQPHLVKTEDFGLRTNVNTMPRDEVDAALQKHPWREEFDRIYDLPITAAFYER